jgi:eukaryotic-like serine/threonine-protein kinase
VAESELTKIGSSLGTLNYMSPEQIRGERCTPATDVFSAGIVFFQLATGRHPFSTRDRSLGQVVSAIVFETPPKLSELAPGAPEGLEFILSRALEKDPARRLQNAGELKQAISLCRVAAQLSPLPAAPAAPAPVVGEGEKTRVFQRLPALGAALEDGGKTRVMPRATAPPAAPLDDDKTKVMKRSSPSPVAPPPPPPPKLPPAASKPSPAPAPTQQLRYCPSCTFANPPHATECERCQTPFSTAAYPTKAGSWPLYLAIAIAVLLAIALIVVLILK